MATPLYYLEDSSSQTWRLGVTDPGAYTTTYVPGISGLTSISIQDTVLPQTWALQVSPTGYLFVVATAAASGPTGLILVSPGGIVYALEVINGYISTVVTTLPQTATVVAACIPDPNADAEGVPSLNGVFTSLVSSGQVVNPPGFPAGTYNFQSFTQAGPDVTAFGGELYSTLNGRQRIIMVVPDQYDDDGIGIDCQYLPWLAQMPPNILGHGGFRAQLQGNGVIRMSPLNEKNDNRYKPLEVLLAPGPPISFEKGVRATEKYLGILFSNKKICGAFFVIQELVQYANPKYGGSRNPKS